MDWIAYLGTGMIFGSTILKRRLHSHLGRAIGSGLWLIYAIQIGSTPLIITEVIAIVIDLSAGIKYREQGSED